MFCFRCIVPGIYVFSWTAVSPPKSETKVGLFINGKETGHQLWAAEYGKQSASQAAVRFNLINEIRPWNKINLILKSLNKLLL